MARFYHASGLRTRPMASVRVYTEREREMADALCACLLFFLCFRLVGERGLKGVCIGMGIHVRGACDEERSEQ